LELRNPISSIRIMPEINNVRHMVLKRTLLEFIYLTG
jgi:hypothetical protein|tara:strand:- start:573 stop:683 length:111 start_codon:yes stop_codon:yes gene_type:complete